MTCRAQATSAPKVTSSPWAKFVSPVVPKTSDSPMAARARIRPNRRPETAYWGARRHGMSARKPGVAASTPAPPSPASGVRRKATVRGVPGSTRVANGFCGTPYPSSSAGSESRSSSIS